MSGFLGKVIIAGGSGFLGQKLARSLIGDGYEVVVLGRQDHGPNLAGRFAQWDGKSLGDWASELDGSIALFNLAGRSVDCRYTRENKALILNSRVDATRILGQAVTDCRKPPAGRKWCLRESKIMLSRRWELNFDFSSKSHVL